MLDLAPIRTGWTGEIVTVSDHRSKVARLVGLVAVDSEEHLRPVIPPRPRTAAWYSYMGAQRGTAANRNSDLTRGRRNF